MTSKFTGSAVLVVFGLLIVHTQSQGVSLDDLIKNVFTPAPDGTTTQVFNPTPPPPTPAPAPAPVPTPDTRVNPDGGGGAYRSCGLDRECVPRHLCVDGAISTTGENFIDIRIDDSVCSYNELCCDIPNKVNILRERGF